MAFTEYTFRQFMQLAFSEGGVPSSKRVIGGVLVIGVIIAAIILASVGGVDFLDGLLQTMLITGASLLGLSSITSICKHPDGRTLKASVGEENEEKNEEI